MAQDDKQSTLTIRILGRDYPISCPPDERETLLSSAEFLARRMQAIQKKGKTLGVDRIAVMAALNTARELLALQQEVERLRSEIDDNSHLAGTAPAAKQPRRDDLENRLAQLQRRVETTLDEPG